MIAKTQTAIQLLNFKPTRQVSKKNNIWKLTIYCLKPPVELEKKCDLSVTSKFSNMTTTKPYPKKAFKQQTIKSFFLRSPSHTIDKSKKNFQKFDASADYSGKQWQPTVFIRRLNLKCDTSGCPSCQNSA